MMKKLNLLWALAILIISGCSSVTVTSDYDKEADFSNYKTLEFLGWAEESNKILNRFDQERIENAFGQEFMKRGFTGVEDSPVLKVEVILPCHYSL
jgi:hypothetical protein